jgi:hypothetical protein
MEEAFDKCNVIFGSCSFLEIQRRLPKRFRFLESQDDAAGLYHMLAAFGPFALPASIGYCTPVKNEVQCIYTIKKG